MSEEKNDTGSIPAGDVDTVGTKAAEIDTALLEYNLSLSYEERLEQHQSALNLFIELQNAGERLRSAKNEARSQ